MGSDALQMGPYRGEDVLAKISKVLVLLRPSHPAPRREPGDALSQKNVKAKQRPEARCITAARPDVSGGHSKARGMETILDSADGATIIDILAEDVHSERDEDNEDGRPRAHDARSRGSSVPSDTMGSAQDLQYLTHR